ncbi:MAG: hypothetical protein AMXMBFR44_2780 [Candidatus Campbellbacteria bacterium]
MKFERPPSNPAETQYGSYLEKNETLIERAHEKAAALIAREAVDPKGFDDVYSSDEIENDLKRVAERTATFENKDRSSLMDKAALAAEALMYEQVGKSDWLSGEGVKVYPEKTTDSDDIFNKTDLVLTFETGEDEEPLAVTVDVTIGMRTLTEKIHSIKQEIDTQSLTTVKYHETPSGEHVPLEKAPRVILGIEPETLMELLPLWLTGDAQGRERLKTHPVQLDVALAIEMQLKAYEEYARTTGKENTADRFKAASGIITAICRGKVRSSTEPVKRKEGRLLRDLRTALDSQLLNPSSKKVLKESSLEERKRLEIIKRLRR